VLTFQNFGLECSVECRCQSGQSADAPRPRVDHGFGMSLTGESPRVARDCGECTRVQSKIPCEMECAANMTQLRSAAIVYFSPLLCFHSPRSGGLIT